MRRGRSLKSWAIDTRAYDGHGYIGVYWFAPNTPPHQAGLKIALFETRAEAQSALRSVKGPRGRGKFPRAAVVRVVITIKEATP